LKFPLVLALSVSINSILSFLSEMLEQNSLFVILNIAFWSEIFQSSSNGQTQSSAVSPHDGQKVSC